MLSAFACGHRSAPPSGHTPAATALRKGIEGCYFPPPDRTARDRLESNNAAILAIPREIEVRRSEIAKLIQEIEKKGPLWTPEVRKEKARKLDDARRQMAKLAPYDWEPLPRFLGGDLREFLFCLQRSEDLTLGTFDELSAALVERASLISRELAEVVRPLAEQLRKQLILRTPDPKAAHDFANTYGALLRYIIPRGFIVTIKFDPQAPQSLRYRNYSILQTLAVPVGGSPRSLVVPVHLIDLFFTSWPRSEQPPVVMLEPNEVREIGFYLKGAQFGLVSVIQMNRVVSQLRDTLASGKTPLWRLLQPKTARHELMPLEALNTLLITLIRGPNRDELRELLLRSVARHEARHAYDHYHEYRVTDTDAEARAYLESLTDTEGSFLTLYLLVHNALGSDPHGVAARRVLRALGAASELSSELKEKRPVPSVEQLQYVEWLYPWLRVLVDRHSAKEIAAIARGLLDRGDVPARVEPQN